MLIGAQDKINITAPTPANEPKISCVGFPDIDPAEFREVMRFDGTVTTIRAKQALVSASMRVQKELSSWILSKIIEDKTGATLNFVTVIKDDLVIDSKPYRAILYINAVYSYASAFLNERMANYDATNHGKQLEKATSAIVDACHRDGIGYIRQIMGESTGHAELI